MRSGQTNQGGDEQAAADDRHSQGIARVRSERSLEPRCRSRSKGGADGAQDYGSSIQADAMLWGVSDHVVVFGSISAGSRA